MPRLKLEIEGMSCNHCVRAVQGALESLPGLRVEEVKVGSAVVEIDDPGQLERIRSTLEEEGYHLADRSTVI